MSNMHISERLAIMAPIIGGHPGQLMMNALREIEQNGAKEVELLEALTLLTEAVEYTPLGIRGITAVEVARATIKKHTRSSQCST